MLARATCVPLFIALAFLCPRADATDQSPFTSFNVYSLGDIGCQSSPYHSDFQGLSGARGSVWFSSMSLNDLGLVASDYAIFVGGAFDMTGAVNNGGIEATGSMHLHSISVAGDISGGADLVASGGLCEGDLRVAGTADLQSFTVTGNIYEGYAFIPTWDHEWVSAFFTERSAYYGALDETGSYELQWGEVLFSADADINVFFIDADVIDAAWGVRITGSDGQSVIINIAGPQGSLSCMSWQLTGTIERSRVLVNFVEAQSLEIVGIEVLGSVLAPCAATSFPSGLVQGGLWVADLQGGGQVNYGYFEEPDEPPTPADISSWGRLKAAFR